MNVFELNRKQKRILKGMYLCEMQPNISWGELADADKIVSDEEIYKHYADTDFCDEDFEAGM